MKMAEFPSTVTSLLLLILPIIDLSSSARNLGNSTPRHNHQKHHKFSFVMKDILNVNDTHPSSKPATAKVNSWLPFPKPVGLFPPYGGIPLSQSDPSAPVTGFSTQTQTLDVSNFGLFFPARAIQELELGTLMTIDEDLYQYSVHGSHVLGKAQGIYVASSEDGTSHLMAMTSTFANSEFKDGLIFFGVYDQKDEAESHIVVIGGSGKYSGANGHATVMVVDAAGGGAAAKQQQKANKSLLFNVYLS